MTPGPYSVPLADQAAATPPIPGGFEGLRAADVQDLYDAVGRIVAKQATALRRLGADAEGRLRLAQVEGQQLGRFLDEVRYRIQYQDGTSPPPAELPSEEQRLAGRADELRRAQSRLEHLSRRIAWFVRQMEASAERMGEPAAGGDEADPWAALVREQLVQGQEAERARLAREVHDGPAQALTNTLLRLQFVESALAARPDEAARELALLRTAVRESLRDVRRFLFNLRPASLGAVGLVGTLQRLISEYRDYTGLPVEATLPENLDLGREAELVVFRVVQEALHNIHKHAAASRILIEVARQAEGWAVHIADDGRGFAADSAGGEVHSGLVGIRERAAIIGGSLDVQSRPGHGTRLTLTIPVVVPDRAGPTPQQPGG
ncbi:MAG: sensor histidine kinase [Chloroflexota bacterium]|nr:sensor histidine kinase [Chloroflexota bacterium]